MMRLLYFIYLFFALTGSDLAVGPLKIKYILSIVLFCWVLITDTRFFSNKIIMPYLLYLTSFAVCSFYTGHVDFFNQFILAVFLSTFVAWRATVILANKDEKTIDIVYYLLIGIGILDVIVTASQFFLATSWYEPIEDFFQFKNREDVFSERNFVADVIGDNTSGIFGTSVTNGYYLAACSLLSFRTLFVRRKGVFYALPVFFILGSFVTQQRTAFAIASIGFIVLSSCFLKEAFNTKKLLLVLVFTILSIVLGLKMVEYSQLYELRYSTLGTDNTGRDVIYLKTFEYIKHNPLFTSFKDCCNYVGHAPHSIFLNAYVWAGPIGFIAIMTILYRQFKYSYQIFRDRHCAYSIMQYCTMFAFIAINMISVTHNSSIVDGSLLFWLLWGLMTYNDCKI